MKIWIITNDEKIFYGPMYCKIINNNHKKIEGIIILPSLIRYNSSYNFLNELKYYFEFLGTKGFLYLAILWIKSFLFSDGNIEKYSKKNNIRVYHLNEIKDCKKILIKFKPDLIISTVNKLVNKSFLNLSKKGWINIHCGDLPRYAGMNGLFWSMYNNEKYLSVSIHLMDEKYDSGKIIRQKKILNNGTPYFTQLSNLLSLASDELISIINDTDEAIKTARINNKLKRTYFSKPSSQNGKEFRKNGGRFI